MAEGGEEVAHAAGGFTTNFQAGVTLGRGRKKEEGKGRGGGLYRVTGGLYRGQKNLPDNIY